MKKSNFCLDLQKINYNAKYLKELGELMFFMEIDVDTLPDDPKFESPKKKQNKK